MDRQRRAAASCCLGAALGASLAVLPAGAGAEERGAEHEADAPIDILELSEPPSWQIAPGLSAGLRVELGRSWCGPGCPEDRLYWAMPASTWRLRVGPTTDLVLALGPALEPAPTMDARLLLGVKTRLGGFGEVEAFLGYAPTLAEPTNPVLWATSP